MARQRQHHGHGMFGSSNSVAGGRIHYHNASACGGFDIDVVQSHTSTGDNLELFAGLDNISGGTRLTADYQGIVITDDALKLIGLQPEFNIDFSLRPQGLNPFLSYRVGN